MHLFVVAFLLLIYVLLSVSEMYIFIKKIEYSLTKSMKEIPK